MNKVFKLLSVFTLVFLGFFVSGCATQPQKNWFIEPPPDYKAKSYEEATSLVALAKNESSILVTRECLGCNPKIAVTMPAQKIAWPRDWSCYEDGKTRTCIAYLAKDTEVLCTPEQVDWDEKFVMKDNNWLTYKPGYVKQLCGSADKMAADRLAEYKKQQAIAEKKEAAAAEAERLATAKFRKTHEPTEWCNDHSNLECVGLIVSGHLKRKQACKDADVKTSMFRSGPEPTQGYRGLAEYNYGVIKIRYYGSERCQEEIAEIMSAVGIAVSPYNFETGLFTYQSRDLAPQD